MSQTWNATPSGSGSFGEFFFEAGDPVPCRVDLPDNMGAELAGGAPLQTPVPADVEALVI
ncbi:MAG: hypothetical protein WCP35_21670 [Verrucomicrobiota bacterium]